MKNEKTFVLQTEAENENYDDNDNGYGNDDNEGERGGRGEFWRNEA